MKKKEGLLGISIIVIFILSGLLPFLVSFIPKTVQYPGIRRVVLISLDSCNPEYLSPDYMPHLYSRILRDGIIFKTAKSILASETQSGHATMLTGSYPSNTGIISNGLYFPEDWKDPETGQVVYTAGTYIATITDHRLILTNTTFEQFANNASIKTGFITGKSRLTNFLSQGADLIFGYSKEDNTVRVPPGYEMRVGWPFTYLNEDSVDLWSLNCLIELLKHDPDTDFIFLNMAYLDDLQHLYGGNNDMIARQLREWDNLFLRLFNELEAIGEYDSTLFVINADHGQDRCDYVVNLHDLFKASINPHIEAKLLSDGPAAFVFLENQGQLGDAITLLEAQEGLSMIIPRDNSSLPGYANYTSIHLSEDRNRSGDIFISTGAHGTNVINENVPFSILGVHGGVSTQDVPMAFFSRNLNFKPELKGYQIVDQVPNTVDVMPTIASIMNWALPNLTLDGTVLDILA